MKNIILIGLKETAEIIVDGHNGYGTFNKDFIIQHYLFSTYTRLNIKDPRILIFPLDSTSTNKMIFLHGF